MKLTKNQLAMLAKCKTAEEAISAAKDEGFDISLAQAESLLSAHAGKIDEATLKAVSGGCSGDGDQQTCPRCGSSNVTTVFDENGTALNVYMECESCGYEWL